ncbi:MAG: lysophospholipid acyltransferase family protein [Cyclonatronaceae bacterium]
MNLFLSILLWFLYGLSFLLSILITLPVFLLTFLFDPYRKIPNRIFMFFGQSMITLNPGWKRKIYGLENYRPDKPLIVVANHLSFLDMPLMATLPWKMKWVSKKEIFNIPVVGWLMRMAGHISIDRGSVKAFESLKTSYHYLENNVPVMIFPEGTRSRDGKMKPFKRGAFILAKEGNYPILPIAIHGTFNLMKPDTWRLNLRGNLILSILPPVDPDGFEDFQTLQNHVFNEIRSEIEKLQISENAGGD